MWKVEDYHINILYNNHFAAALFIGKKVAKKVFLHSKVE